MGAAPCKQTQILELDFMSCRQASSPWILIRIILSLFFAFVDSESGKLLLQFIFNTLGQGAGGAGVSDHVD